MNANDHPRRGHCDGCYYRLVYGACRCIAAVEHRRDDGFLDEILDEILDGFLDDRGKKAARGAE